MNTEPTGTTCQYTDDLIGRRGTTRHGTRIEVTGPAVDPSRCYVVPLMLVGSRLDRSDAEEVIDADAESFPPQVASIVFDAIQDARSVEDNDRPLTGDERKALAMLKANGRFFTFARPDIDQCHHAAGEGLKARGLVRLADVQPSYGRSWVTV